MTIKPLVASQRAWLEEVVSTYERALTPESPGSMYLAARGHDLDFAGRHRLGYSGPTDSIPGLERFYNHVVIPYRAADGHVTAIKFRALEDRGVRYGVPEGQSTARLFNVGAVLSANRYLCVVEGEFDALALDALGIPAVGIAGVDNWRPHFARLFEGIETIVYIKDDDEPKPVPGKFEADGVTPIMRIASDRLLEKLRHDDLPVRIIKAPGGHKDAAAAYAAGLGDDLRQAVEDAL